MKNKILVVLCLAAALLGCSNVNSEKAKSTQIYEKNELKSQTVYTYDKDGKILYGVQYDEKGKAKEKIVYSYDEKDVFKVGKIELSASKNVIYADGEDALEFETKVYNKYGEEISNKDVEIYVNGQKYTKKKFKSDKAGEYTVKAKYKEVESNQVYVRTREYTNPVTQEYLDFFNHNKLHNIEIKITRAEWDRLLNNLKKNKLSSEDVAADMIYTGELGKITMNKVGFKVRGNASRGLPQNNGEYTKVPFKIKFDETFDMKKDDPKYEQTKNRRLFALSGMNLKWNRKYDDTQIREMFNYELMGKAGVTVPKTASVLLKINIDGEIHNYGLYTVIEPIDGEFLTKYYGPTQDRGNLYKCLYPATLAVSSITNKYAIGLEDEATGYRPIYDLKTNKNKKDYKSLEDFIYAIDYYKKEAFENYIDKNFEIDKFIRYMAMNNLIGMYDDYRDNINNFYMYFNDKGKIDFLPYDYDSGLGGGWPGWKYEETVNNSIYRENPQSALCTKILRTEKYKKLYEKYLEEFVSYENPIFAYENFEKKYYQMKKVYDGKIANDMKQGDEMKLDPVVEKYITAKTAAVRNQLGMKPKVVRAQKNPDMTITNIEEFFSRLESLEVSQRDQFVYDNFTNIANKTEFPIIKGNNVTFVYKSDGKNLPKLELRGEMNGWGFDGKNERNIAFRNIEGTDIYIYKIEMAKGEYEYKFTINRITVTREQFEKLTDDEKMKVAGQMEWLMDSLNPKEKVGGFGANSFIKIMQ